MNNENVSFGSFWVANLTIPIFLNLKNISNPEIRDYFTEKLMYSGSSLLMPQINDSIHFFEGHGLFVFKKQRFFLHKKGFLCIFKIKIDIDGGREQTVLCGFKKYIEEDRTLIKEILNIPYFKSNPFRKVLTVTDDPFKPLCVARLPANFMFE